jgi:outer membrane protein TolC
VAIVSPILDELTRDEERSQGLLSACEITNMTAVDRRDAVLALQSQLLEAEARRIDAAVRVQLMTGLEAEPEVTLGSPGESPVAVAMIDDRMDAIAGALESSRARLRQVSAAGGFQAMLSGYAGVGAARSSFGSLTSDGSFGVYGLRIHLSYPLFRGLDRLSLAEARADLEQNLLLQAEAVDAARLKASEYRLRLGSAEKRIDLLHRSLEAASEREAVLTRLVEADLRLPSDLAHATADRARRQVALLGAKVERWKAGMLLAGNAAATGNE